MAPPHLAAHRRHPRFSPRISRRPRPPRRQQSSLPRPALVAHRRRLGFHRRTHRHSHHGPHRRRFPPRLLHSHARFLSPAILARSALGISRCFAFGGTNRRSRWLSHHRRQIGRAHV